MAALRSGLSRGWERRTQRRRPAGGPIRAVAERMMQTISSQAAGRRIAIVLASVAALCGSGAAAAYRETAVADGGRIVGTGRVTGDVTPFPPPPVFKEKECCSDRVP